VIKQKHSILRPAWLSHVGHKRPGNAAGLPIDQALAKAIAFTADAKRLARSSELSLPHLSGEWNGYAKHELTIAGKQVTVVAPKATAPGRPWVWHGEFFGHKPAPDIALLGKGFHIVYMKINDMLGSPSAVQLWNQCYATLTSDYAFSTKPALVGLSRGGLYCYNWAIANPTKVSCIYGDAPVCDFKSWPGGKGKGKGDPKNWSFVMKLWNFKDEAEALAYKGNPVDSLAALAKNHVPLLHVYGDADDVVPADENTAIMAKNYQALGGSITLIAKPGVGHHPHGLEDSTPIIEFILKHAK
jgi:pimeloyl-ACP methyl ester carboxylesterase